jgi:hypothetical protein
MVNNTTKDEVKPIARMQFPCLNPHLPGAAETGVFSKKIIPFSGIAGTSVLFTLFPGHK